MLIHKRPIHPQVFATPDSFRSCRDCRPSCLKNSEHSLVSDGGNVLDKAY